jgi:hypothetical protein
MTTRATIRGWAERYLHRDDWSEEDISTAIAVTSAELGSRLRAPENAVRLEVDPAEWVNPYPLPSDFRAVSSVLAPQVGGYRALEAVPPGALYAASQDVGGAPWFYTVQGGELLIAPMTALAYVVLGWGEPAPLALDGGSTNAVLTAYPELYRYRVLAELGMIAQDGALIQSYLQLYEARVDQINMQAINLRLGDAPTIRSS